jgi:quinol monooxygenase YgiN
MLIHVAEVRVFEASWEEFEWSMRKLILQVRHVDGLLANWIARSLSDPETAQLVSVWEDRERMEAYWRSSYYRQEGLPHFIAHLVGEVSVATSDVLALWTRLPAGYHQAPRHHRT